MSQQQQLSEETALRLLNSMAVGTTTAQAVGQVQPQVQAYSEGNTCASGSGGVSGGGCGVGVTQLGVQLPTSAPGQSSQESVHSANEFGNSCRICRWNRSDMEIINCPCKCKGSVGYIHLKCLKRWIMHRRDNRCEICNAPFNITTDRASIKQMVRAFCCGRCCGMIVKHILFSASLMPLAHVILQQVSKCTHCQHLWHHLIFGLVNAYLRFFTCEQVLYCMDNLNQGSTEQLTVQEVSVASCALLTSSALFFHFFEFVTTRFLLIRNILRHWWMFGSTNDFGLVEVEDDAFDLF